MVGMSRDLAVAQLPDRCGQCATRVEPIAALPELAGTRAILYCELVYSLGLHGTVPANAKRCLFAQPTVGHRGLINRTIVRAAKAAPIAASQAKEWRGVVQ